MEAEAASPEWRLWVVCRTCAVRDPNVKDGGLCNWTLYVVEEHHCLGTVLCFKRSASKIRPWCERRI